ncbi:DUF3426 domain-containing protein [Psychrobacter sp. JCM 18900]|uniref:DUF3426 domain-containing protein n=1 Tax=Psychrobacter sp. JCM 18900 TaxID=1298608 RepID=UPI0004363535|nr:DUF3426 domain-containing protein [Psychrobacter sp. JCM 18900]GAF52795.1 hypothetical protein JCM18900_11330 [Psychrobacter sp. JCM 18900]
MTTPIKTQCPHCQACYSVKQTQLNQVNATISCDRCQQSFLVNKHLVVNSEVIQKPTPQKNIPAQQKAQTQPISNEQKATTSSNQHNPQNVPDRPTPSISKKKSSGTLIHDDLIYDDMDIDDPEEDVQEYDSLDSMDAWLTQASNTSPSVATTEKPKAPPSKETIKSSNSSTKKPSTSTISASSSTQDMLSSAAANDIHANVESTDNHSWLQKLLEEQNQDEETPQDDTDLSQLLSDMGVPVKDEDPAADDRLRKTQLPFAPTQTTRSIASLLWILGCLVLALLLAAQYVIFNLENLVKNPSYAQRLQSICSVAACSLPSADLSTLTISNTFHRSSQIKTTGTFSDIGATLSNGSPQSQLYPNVKISVYGKDEIIGEFIADPNDYLLGKQSQLAANTDRQLLFTIPVANAQIRDITMTALY